MNNPRYSDELVEETIRLFQPHFTTPLNRQDAEELIARAAGFIRVFEDFLPAVLEQQALNNSEIAKSTDSL